MAKDFFVTDVLRTAYCDSIVDAADANSPPGEIRIYSGAVPATADAAETGTAAVVITLANPAWGPASAGVATLNSPPGPGTATSDADPATHFRIYDGAGNVVAQGLVGIDSSFDLQLSNTTIRTDDEVDVQSLTVTVNRSLTE